MHPKSCNSLAIKLFEIVSPDLGSVAVALETPTHHDGEQVAIDEVGLTYWLAELSLQSNINKNNKYIILICCYV